MAKLYRSIFEGVLDYRHTPSNLSSITTRTPPAVRTPVVGEDEYLRKHGARITSEDDLLPASAINQTLGDEEDDDRDDDLVLDYEEDEEESLSHLQDELERPGNVDFYYNSHHHGMPVARALAISKDRTLYFIKYVDYFEDEYELTFAVVPVADVKHITRTIVGIPEGGNAYEAYATLDRQGRIKKSVAYGSIGRNAMQQAIRKGLIKKT